MKNSKLIDRNRESIILLALVIPGEGNQTQISIRGTGFIISSDGKFITCTHVLKEIEESKKRYLEAKIPTTPNEKGVINYERCDVEVLKIDEENDLALMQLKNPSVKKFKPVEKIGDAEKIHEGDEVLSLGYPLATEFLAMGFGLTMSANQSIVSSIKRRAIDSSLHYLMIDTHTNNGASGSPLFLQESGEVIGVVSGRISSKIVISADKPPIDIPANMGICRPINYYKNLIK